jgi:hypothetical protein
MSPMQRADRLVTAVVAGLAGASVLAFIAVLILEVF